MNATPLSITDLEAGYDNPEWLGWGYLGGRAHLTPTERENADRALLTFANEHNWSADWLFRWCNSKPGRWYADDPTSAHVPALFADNLGR